MKKRKRLSAVERKQSIIEATIRVVARLNFDRATTAEIAKEAAINEALIYNHFSSKGGLLLSMLDYIHQSDEETYEKILNEPASKRKISAWQTVTKHYMENSDKEALMRICTLKAMVAIDPDIRKKARNILEESHRFFHRHLEADQDRGLYIKGFDIDIISWIPIAWDMLFTSISIMESGISELPKEHVLESVKALEGLLKPQGN